MPVFHGGAGQAPAWCEVEYFDIVRPEAGAGHIYEPAGIRETIFAVSGGCRLRVGERLVDLSAGEHCDVRRSPGDGIVVEAPSPETVLVRMCGRWRDPIGGCGLFAADRTSLRRNAGDLTAYPRSTDFDNHYHDCDEYWVITQGRCVAVSEGACYVLQAGDCLATGMGHHHDLIDVLEPVRGIYFESTLEGASRPGHLWNHTHGAAVPDPRRV